MKKQTQKLSVLLLLAVLFASCGTEAASETAQTQNDPAAESAADTAPETEQRLIEQLPEADFGGYDFRVLSYINATWPQHEFLAETSTGDTLNDAVYARNQAVEERYHITLSVTESNTPKDQASKAVKAGDDAYDLFDIGSGDSFSLALSGMLYDLAQMENMDFSKPWWSKQYIEDASLAGHTWLALSACNTYATDTTPIVLFNKSLFEEYDLEVPYAAVHDKTWTLDRMTALAKNVSADIDGNSIMDEKDKYGLVGNNYINDVFLYGCNIFFVGKDTDGLPVYQPNEEYLTSVMEKLCFLTDSAYAFVADRYKVDREAAPLNAFSESRALFWACPISALFKLRDSDADFGIVPVPMFSEEQGRYTSFVTTDGTVLSVPETVTDTGRTGMLAEALSAVSYELVHPAYYTDTLEGKLSRDEESFKMLDIVFDSYVCDIGNLLRGSGLSLVGDLRAVITKPNTELASLLAKNEKAYRKAVDRAAEQLTEIH